MKGVVGKDTPEKEMDFYDVTHDTLSFLPCFINTYVRPNFSLPPICPFEFKAKTKKINI